jgi:hypothetical protein
MAICEYVEAGGLMSADFDELMRRMADDVHEILNGGSPSGCSHRFQVRPEFACCSLLERDGFELLVPPQRNSPRAPVVSALDPTSSERH